MHASVIADCAKRYVEVHQLPHTRAGGVEMTEYEMLADDVRADDRDVYDVIMVPRHEYPASRINEVIANCARHYVAATTLLAQNSDSAHVALQRAAWINLVNAT